MKGFTVLNNNVLIGSAPGEVWYIEAFMVTSNI